MIYTEKCFSIIYPKLCIPKLRLVEDDHSSIYCVANMTNKLNSIPSLYTHKYQCLLEICNPHFYVVTSQLHKYQNLTTCHIWSNVKFTVLFCID